MWRMLNIEKIDLRPSKILLKDTEHICLSIEIKIKFYHLIICISFIFDVFVGGA